MRRPDTARFFHRLAYLASERHRRRSPSHRRDPTTCEQGRCDMSNDVFERRESAVRTYCRHFPQVFSHAHGTQLWDEDGSRYLDFLSGAGVLNYGHANPRIVRRLLEYLQRNGLIHSLDLHTTAKRAFLEKFEEIVLIPRELDYRVQFTGPTGTNAVEAAIKLARKV